MLERLQKIIARAGIASRRHAEELIKSGLVTVNGQTVTELGTKADESKDHIKVQGKLLRPETERVYLLLNKPPEVLSTMVDPEGRRSLTDLLYGVSQRVFPVGRLEYHSMGLVFLTNDGELANLMLQAHHLPQTYNLKLKTLLTFEEIEELTQATGARITRLKGKDAPWYEVTLSEARRDALRNRLFQTGHPVEKIKRVKIGNLAMEELSAGHYRPLSDAEVATLRRMVQPGAAAQPGIAIAAAARAGLPATGAPAPAIAALMARRPFVKRRPYQPKPKPGEGKRQNQPFTPREPAQAAQDFRNERPEHGARPAPPLPFVAPSPARFQNARPGAPPRADFKSQPAAGGVRGPKPPFSKPGFSKPGFSKPRDAKSRGPWKPRQPFKSDSARGARPGRGGKPFQKFRSDSFKRSVPDAEYDRPIKPRPEAPWRRPESSQGAGRAEGPARAKFGGPRGAKAGAPWKSRRPTEPGAFGRAKGKFSKPGRPAGIKPGGRKRGGPGQHRPKPGNFSGPRGKR
ncbi:MAG: S4 domain-containing protein [Candidatus Acidiferrales bacterium]